MTKNKATTKHRSWHLVTLASILIVCGAALIFVAVTNISNFGWWSLPIGLSGLATATAATLSIIKNDPTWILLDLIIPG